MKVPASLSSKTEFIKWIVDTCTASQPERLSLYEKRRRYYLYGQNSSESVRLKRIKAHLTLVASFLYSQDSLAYSIAAPDNADDQLVQQYLAIQDDWNSEFTDCGLADLYNEALNWSLVYDTEIIKLGWNDRSGLFGDIVQPWSFGVFREDRMDFESQPAMTHSYLLDWDDAVTRIERAGKGREVSRLVRVGEEGSNALPPTIQQMIISATGGSNLAGNVQGQINPEYEDQPLYKPRLDVPLVRLHEATVFDEEADDWRMFTMVDPDILLDDSAETIEAIKAKGGPKKSGPKYDSDTNLFLKKETPFVVVRPFKLPDYFWGDAHSEDLIQLQNWSNERLEQINEILERQADPPKSFTGFMSQDEGKMAAWGGPGSWVYDQIPGAKAEDHPPQMPEDLFAEFAEIGNLMLEASGLTEGIVGRGEKNVRGAGHHKELKITGGGRIRRVAVGLEDSLARLGDIALRLKAKNDDEKLRLENGDEFLIAQVLDQGKHTLSVSGHSHSPLFTSETREQAAMLLKAQAIDAEWFARMMNPPQLRNILHSLRKRAAAQAKQREEMMKQGIVPGQKPRLRAAQ